MHYGSLIREAGSRRWLWCRVASRLLRLLWCRITSRLLRLLLVRIARRLRVVRRARISRLRISWRARKTWLLEGRCSRKAGLKRWKTSGLRSVSRCRRIPSRLLRRAFARLSWKFSRQLSRLWSRFLLVWWGTWILGLKCRARISSSWSLNGWRASTTYTATLFIINYSILNLKHHILDLIR